MLLSASWSATLIERRILRYHLPAIPRGATLPTLERCLALHPVAPGTHRFNAAVLSMEAMRFHPKPQRHIGMTFAHHPTTFPR